MKSAAFLLTLLGACGGRELAIGPDGGVVSPHGPPCTQSSCASLVFVIASMPIDPQEGEQIQKPGLFVGGGFVYTSTPSHLVRAPVSGGAFELVAPAALTYAIVADDQNVYWSSNDQQVSQMPHKGGAITTYSTAGLAIFVDAQNLYWSTVAGLVSVPIAGGTPALVPFADSHPSADSVLFGGRAFAQDCTTLTIGSQGEIVAGYGVVSDGVRCYEAPVPSGDVVSLPVGGGASTILAAHTTSPWMTYTGQRMMIDSEGVYVVRNNGATCNGSDVCGLSRIPIDGSGDVHVTTDLTLAYDVTADTIYWVTLDENLVLQLKSMPKYAP